MEFAKYEKFNLNNFVFKRDYKEHGGKGKTSESGLVKDDKTRSTPSLSSWNTTTTRNRDFGRTISTASITSDVNSKDETVFNGQHKPTELNTKFVHFKM